jgi:hypothetical protein
VIQHVSGDGYNLSGSALKSRLVII